MHLEGAIGASPARPDSSIGRRRAGRNATDRDQTISDRTVVLGIGQVGTGQWRTSAGTDVSAADGDDALEYADAGSSAGEASGRVVVVVVIPSRLGCVPYLIVVGELDEAMSDWGHALAADDQLCVVAGAALDVPRVPVMTALERGGLHPLVAVVQAGIWRDNDDRITVGTHVGNDDVAVVVGKTGGLGSRQRVAGVAACWAIDSVEHDRVRSSIVVEHDVPVPVQYVLGAQGISVHIGSGFRQHVVDVDGETGHVGRGIGYSQWIACAVAVGAGDLSGGSVGTRQQCLRLTVPLAVGRGVVVVHVHTKRRGLLRQRVHRDDEGRSILFVHRRQSSTDDREVHAVDLEAAGRH